MTVEKIIYVGCYTEVPYAPEQVNNGIYVVKLKDGNLEILSKREEKNVTFFLVDKNRSKLYGVSEAKPPISALHRFDINEETGELSDHIEMDFQDSGACYIGGLSAKKGALLAIAFYDSGVVHVINDESDMLTSQNPIVFKEKSDVVKDRQSSAHPHAAYPLKTGDEFLVPDLGADTLYKLRVNGHSTRILHEIKLLAGSGPRHVVVHPQHNLLFVVSELANTLTVFETDGLYEHLTLTDEHSTLGWTENSYTVPEDSLQTAAHIQLSNDGLFILVSNRGRYNSISIFRLVNPAEGKIELVNTVSSQGHFPRFFTLIEDRYLLIANQLSNSVLLFHFDKGRVSDQPISSLNIPNPAALAIF